MGHDVFIKSGEQPRRFSWGNAVSPVYSTTTETPSLPFYKESPYSTFQATVSGTGAVTATVSIKVTNDDETGRGVVLSGMTAPGIQVSTTSGSATITARAGKFDQNLVGTVIAAPGVPAGTTVSSVAVGGSTLTASANATATGTVQCIFYKTRWVETPLGVITLSGSDSVTDGVTSIAPWRYVRLSVADLTGTGATVTGLMGV